MSSLDPYPPGFMELGRLSVEVASVCAVIQELSGFPTGSISWTNHMPVSPGFMSVGGDIVGAFVWYDALCRVGLEPWRAMF